MVQFAHKVQTTVMIVDYIPIVDGSIIYILCTSTENILSIAVSPCLRNREQCSNTTFLK